MAYRVLLVGSGLRLTSRLLFEGESLLPAGPACDFRDALEAVRREYPDVVVVDLSSTDALGAIQRIMAEKPVPILALHPGVLSGGEAFQALAFGALDVVERPEAPGPEFWLQTGRKLVLLAQVRVGRNLQAAAPRGVVPEEIAPPPFPLVAIASSLGGPRALSLLLRSMPRAFPAPVVICQHISQGFTEGLAHWLSQESALRVLEATQGELMERGTVYIAPSGSHLVVRPDGRLNLDPGPPVRGFRPSCDLLLASAAEAFGRRCIGVILTGMGRDGARGLKEIRERGGRTIAQNAETCVVYGMPGAAVQLGAAQEVLPLEQIGPTLVQWVEAC
ncbi:chemotaxis protein CheB [Myxococcaceae bacterium GXIMD 01537]